MTTSTIKYFERFRKGSESGLEFFYGQLRPALYIRGLRYTKDDVNADCIVNEAFIRLWLLRKEIQSPQQLKSLVTQLAVEGFKAYYKSSSSRFNRNMLRLEELENHDKLIGSDDPAFLSRDVIFEEEDDDSNREKLERIEKMIPNLTNDQQMFIRLCMKYSFSYERIAWHIGGISDYQVARRVEKTLQCLRSILSDTSKIDKVAKTSRYVFEGDLGQEQLSILRMRYELQYSFAEIADALDLEQGHVQRVFANSCKKIRKVKAK